MNIYRLEDLNKLMKAPEDPGEFAEWVEQDDVIPFLESEVEDEYVILYAVAEYGYMSGLLIPAGEVSAEQFEALQDWQPVSSSSWGVWSNRDRTWLEPALAGERAELMRQGEVLFYGRGFEGDRSLRSYFELSQKLAHVLGLHYLEGRKAWCKLDHLGDVVEVVKLFRSEERGNRFTILAMRRDALAEYSGLTNTQLLRMFDFTRLDRSRFLGWGDLPAKPLPEHPTIKGKIGLMPGCASYTRGVQLAPLALSPEEVHRRHGMSSHDRERKYERFIALDAKNKRIAELSSDPDELDSYFVDTGKPWQVTPAFFRPEVLLKYKADSEKYTIRDRTIECRGSWYLQTYDINDAGQVHTYLIYLSRLPHEEQLHWKQYNEAPKTGISKRAYATDIQGAWHDEYDPLDSLKERLRTLDREGATWWTLRDSSYLDRVHYPVTSSQDEWEGELGKLHQLLVEGLNQTRVKAVAQETGQPLDPRYRTLKLLELSLIGLGFEDEHAYELLGPFHELHNLRNKVVSHTPGSEAGELVGEIKRNNPGFPEHFRGLVTALDTSLEIIAGALKE